VTRAVIPWRDHLESLNLLLSAIAIDFPSLCLTVSLWIRKPSMVQRESKGDDFFGFGRQMEEEKHGAWQS